MRRFVLDSGSGRKTVTLEIRGSILRITQSTPDGNHRRSERALASEADAHRAAARMAAELTGRDRNRWTSGPDGFVTDLIQGRSAAE